MVVIFLFSTDLFAASESESIVRAIVRRILPSLSESGIEGIHTVIRKGAHVATYGILCGLYTVGLVKGFDLKSEWTRSAGITAVVLAVAYACLDEWHQSFSEVRAGTLIDVGWDAIGACLMQFFLALRTRKKPI